MLTRDKIIEQAYHECMVEMYAKSQPPADFNQLLSDAKAGKIGKDEKIYERHYLLQEEFKYILNKYKKAYNIKSKWEDYVEIIENYWGCILRQKVSIKLSVQVNFYLTKIRAEPYKNN